MGMNAYAIGCGIAVLVVVLAGYWVMTIFAGVVSSINAKFESDKKRKREEEKKYQNVA